MTLVQEDRRPPSPPCGAVLLAAGQSRRMGADKLVADLGGKPVIAHVLDRIAAAGLPPPIVVLSPDGDAIRAALADREGLFVVAENSRAGLSQSLRAGIAAVPVSWEAAFICLGDMPLIPPDLLRRMTRQASADSIFVPRHSGEAGNPVLWGRSHFPRLTSLSGDAGARRLFGELESLLRYFDTDDPGVSIDLDTPDALDRVRRLVSKGG